MAREGEEEAMGVRVWGEEGGVGGGEETSHCCRSISASRARGTEGAKERRKGVKRNKNYLKTRTDECTPRTEPNRTDSL